MFNLFKNKKSPAEIIESAIAEPRAKHTSIVQEIHDTFNSEVERILEAAGIIQSLEHGRDDLLAKAAKLKKLGFSSTKEVKEAEDLNIRLQKIKTANEENQRIKEAAGYFSIKYPQYKFITEASIKIICEKYGLIYGEVSHYTGTVPDKNIQDMETHGIAVEDKCFEAFVTAMGMAGSFGHRLVDYGVYRAYEQRRAPTPDSIRFISMHDEVVVPSPLIICAPEKDFDKRRMQITNKKLSPIIVEDPVVCAPVFHKGYQYFLVITAWGDEASDELVVNQKMN